MPIYRIPQGEVTATERVGICSTEGVRYAVAPPFGPPEPWLKACPETSTALQVAHPPASPQTSSLTLDNLLGGFPEDTDQNPHCQYLSVTAPRQAHKAPVMVWLHGGGYANSAPTFPLYDPQWLVSEQDVVVVKVGYRLGYLGFGGSTEEHPPNLGAMDIVAALRWVHETIEHFGGDPENVTLFGESAGADAALALMAVPETKPYFHRVIAQSAPLGIHPLPETKMRKTLVEEGVWRPSIDQLVQAQKAIEKAAWGYGHGFMPFGIRWGCDPFPQGNRLRLIAEGASPRSVLIGTNAHEAGNYLAAMRSTRALYANKWGQRILNATVVAATTWGIFSKASQTLYRKLRRRTEAAYYTYRRLDQPTVHMSELPLLFGGSSNPAWAGSDLLGAKTEEQLEELDRDGKEFRAIWANFARQGTCPDASALRGQLKVKF